MFSKVTWVLFYINFMSIATKTLISIPMGPSSLQAAFWSTDLSFQVYGYSYVYTRKVGTRGFDYNLEDFEPYPCLQNPFLTAPWYQSEGDVYNYFKVSGICFGINFQRSQIGIAELYWLNN